MDDMTENNRKDVAESNQVVNWEIPDDRSMMEKDAHGLTRRQVLAGGAVGLTATLLPLAKPTEATASSPVTSPETNAETIPVTLHVNGRRYTLQLEPRVSLLDALREYIGLTGTKKVCNQGTCGACTVHVNGRRINSCLTFAVMYQGTEITTIEGLAQAGVLHPVQAAFIEHDAFQCGFCTSGQIMSAAALLREGHIHSDEEIREWMSGNLCRCAAYLNILAAIKEAAGLSSEHQTAIVTEGGA